MNRSTSGRFPLYGMCLRTTTHTSGWPPSPGGGCSHTLPAAISWGTSACMFVPPTHGKKAGVNSFDDTRSRRRRGRGTPHCQLNTWQLNTLPDRAPHLCDCSHLPPPRGLLFQPRSSPGDRSLFGQQVAAEEGGNLVLPGPDAGQVAAASQRV